jgi:hypothetical protein
LGDRSLYKKIEERQSHELAEKIWNIWKKGRNQIFHYFPHNLRAVSFDEASGIVNEILQVMEESYERLNKKTS